MMVNRILLTGAGFTHNFGAPLASEVSTLIFNSLPSNSQLLDLLRNNFDYEAVYQAVIQSKDYDDIAKIELTKAIKDVYNVIDKILDSDPSQHMNLIKFKDFIMQFVGTRASGFIFSLNQDLFMENTISRFPDVSMEQPVLGSWFNESSNPIKPKKRLNISYDNFDDFKHRYENNFDKKNSKIFYIKLHGSQNWFTTDTNQIMVIGHGKSKRIKVEPLLEWYFEIFKSQLNKYNSKLLIIGYSFRDEHINQVIYDNRENLKIYIINSQSFENFSNDLKNRPFGLEIAKLINKYYSVTLSQLFGVHGHEAHPYLNQLHVDYFDNKYYEEK